ncbi:MAG: hypothetical protein Ct9H300mP28_15310 [Pseudomonadota bacterium]|nr:MAG: hypothetical protein Ct9H300mP28_15310 [Pseudomonadota bacterium]
MAGDPGAILEAVHKEFASNKKNGSENEILVNELRSEEIERTEKLMPMFKSEESPFILPGWHGKLMNFLLRKQLLGDGGIL